MNSRLASTQPKSMPNCEHAMFLESSLMQLRDTGLLSDVTIVCGSQTFKAHKIILVASSGYFYNIFTNKLKKDVKHLAMTDISADILKIILDYIYTGLLNVNRFMKVNQEALIRALHHLDMSDVYRHRLHLMMKSLAPNYYSELWSLADIYQMKDMSTEIAKYISQNLEMCMENSHFVNLTLPQLIAVLSSENLKNQSEVMTLEAIQKWIMHDVSRRERFATNLLSVAKVTVSAKTKAIAFYDTELQNFLTAPSRRKLNNSSPKKDRGKKNPLLPDRGNQVLIANCRNEKSDKTIRIWKKKTKADDVNLIDMSEEKTGLKNFDYHMHHGDYQLENDLKESTISDDNTNFSAEFTSEMMKSERVIENYDREIARAIIRMSPQNRNNEIREDIYIDKSSPFNDSSIDQSLSHLSNEPIQSKLLPPSAVSGDLRKKCKKPIRVHSIQIAPSENQPRPTQMNQFSEERMQIIKLKSKLNSIINRIRSSLQKNSTFPNAPPSDDDMSSVCSKQSDATFTDAEISQINSSYEQYQNGPVLPLASGAYAQYVTDVTSVSTKVGYGSSEKKDSSITKLSLTLNLDDTEGDIPISTFRISEQQTARNRQEGQECQPEMSARSDMIYKSPKTSIILNRPIATSNESLISPEEVRCRLEKFKKLMHTKCSSPFDVEKINLKGSRSFIISGNEGDAVDSTSDHCDFLSDISEADTMLDSSSNEDCMESQPEWFRTLSTIPEEASICDFNGSSHTEIELRSEKSDSPLKFGEKCKFNWNIKEQIDESEQADDDDNNNYMNSTELNDLGKNMSSNIFGCELDDQFSEKDNFSNIVDQQESIKSNVDMDFHSDSKLNAASWQSMDSASTINKPEKRASPEMANCLSDIIPLCKLKVSDTNTTENSGTLNRKDEFTSSTKYQTEKSISSDCDSFDQVQFQPQTRGHNVFEFGGYQCFAEKSIREENESATARSNDTLNITLENLINPARHKMKNMPIANDTWKMWKTKLEASCKPSPRPIKKTVVQTEIKTTSSTTEETITTESAISDAENEKLRKALHTRITALPKVKITVSTNPSPTPSTSIPTQSRQVSPLSVQESPQRTVRVSPRSNIDEVHKSIVASERSEPTTYSGLDLGGLTAKDEDSCNITGRTHVISSNKQYKPYMQSRSESPLQERNVDNSNYQYKDFMHQESSAEKMTYGQIVNENRNYQSISLTNSENSFDGTDFEHHTMKIMLQRSCQRSCEYPDDGPVLILLATNKSNEASQQVYCLRKRCWLPQRKLLMPPIENNYSVGYFEGNVYYIGGLANGSFRKTNSVLVYRSVEHTLVAAADLLVARVGAGVSNLNNKIYVAGGVGRYHKPISQVERYDTKADRWHLVAALRIARTNVSLVTSGKLLYAIGGTVSADSVQEVVSKACESYDSEIDQWSLLVELPSHFLMTNPLVTSVDDKLYAVRISKPDTVFRFHTRKNKWLPIQNTKLNASKICCILPGERKLYAVELAGKAIYSFDMHAFQWEVETHFPAGLHWQAAAFVIGLDESS